ncbi:hypothetical protein KIN34_04765 [Cellulomonas sp. DKR-3]|uniref:Ig-like domain-containing protein n=1 Tax=Cellulomonas fulva TaxID=2835530 RepID=A0ABS5TWX5_9CELL|nr:hypothetical protein [Cellulomonas fulva]MBT0993597.1 hypothetical protein [Cellulomonas fulva]
MTSEHDVVSRLRDVSSTAPVPPLDADAVLALGRRARRRRALVRGSCVLAVFLAAGTVLGQVERGTPTPTADRGSFASAASTPAEILDSYRGWPTDVAVDTSEGGVVDLEAGTVTVWTTTSSSCFESPEWVRASGSTVHVTFSTDRVTPPPEGVLVCTADSVPQTFVIALPVGYAPDGEPSVVIEVPDGR